MKFRITLNPEQTNILIAGIEHADEEGCEDAFVTIDCEIDKNKKCKVQQICISGECTTEYSSGNLIT